MNSFSSWWMVGLPVAFPLGIRGRQTFTHRRRNDGVLCAVDRTRDGRELGECGGAGRAGLQSRDDGAQLPARPLQAVRDLALGIRFVCQASDGPKWREAVYGCHGSGIRGGADHLATDLVHVEALHSGNDLLELGAAERAGLREDENLVAEDHEGGDR